MHKFEVSKEVKQDMIEEIKRFFENERDETISEFQATIFLDFMLSNIGPYIYNQAIEDAYKMMQEKIEDLYCLEKRQR